MKKGYGNYAVCLLCDHYKIVHHSCCSCQNYTERDLILNTLDMIIEEGGSGKHETDCILVSRNMLKLISAHIQHLQKTLIKRN